ncbi:hypothetical protein, partial [Mesorhizobium sp.]|uniref:hypothetical protein n=1 Tax=Mesorhizobium sp. TaxID=1871066 RepID=UPI0025C481E7
LVLEDRAGFGAVFENKVARRAADDGFHALIQCLRGVGPARPGPARHFRNDYLPRRRRPSK